MKYFDWNKEKNEHLKKTRGISFEDVINNINVGNLLESIGHPNKEKYPNQKMWVVKIEDYVYLVPVVEDEKKFFLKTIFPSRKATSKYLAKRRKTK